MDIDSAVKNLESFVDLSEKSGDFREQQRACSAIGEMLNTLVCFYVFSFILLQLFETSKSTSYKLDFSAYLISLQSPISHYY